MCFTLRSLSASRRVSDSDASDSYFCASAANQVCNTASSSGQPHLCALVLEEIRGGVQDVVLTELCNTSKMVIAFQWTTRSRHPAYVFQQVKSPVWGGPLHLDDHRAVAICLGTPGPESLTRCRRHTSRISRVLFVCSRVFD